VCEQRRPPAQHAGCDQGEPILSTFTGHVRHTRTRRWSRVVHFQRCRPDLGSSCGSTTVTAATTPPAARDRQDAAAYAAGERAALARAFQLALPGQQALGALQAGLGALRAAAAADGAALRGVQLSLAGATATLQVRPRCAPAPRLPVAGMPGWVGASRALHARAAVVRRHGLPAACSAWLPSWQRRLWVLCRACEGGTCSWLHAVRRSPQLCATLPARGARSRGGARRRRWRGGWTPWRACVCPRWTRGWTPQPPRPCRRHAARLGRQGPAGWALGSGTPTGAAMRDFRGGRINLMPPGLWERWSCPCRSHDTSRGRLPYLARRLRGVRGALFSHVRLTGGSRV